MTAESRKARAAMTLSLATGVVMILVKVAAWRITHSAAILSDAAESVVHIFAVGFAAFSLWLSFRPANERFNYGYERVSFFSAGFEGAAIIIAAVYIVVEASVRWRMGAAPENLPVGLVLVGVTCVANLGLGLHLVRVGRSNGSLILEANGKHVLTDVWTSVGVFAGLLLVIGTGWKPFDPLMAILMASNILYSGGKLVWRSVKGLMDYADPSSGDKIDSELRRICPQAGVQYHEVRYRSTGSRTIIEVHLLFPYDTPLGRAHEAATRVERELTAALPFAAEVITHLESIEDHDAIHPLGI